MNLTVDKYIGGQTNESPLTARGEAQADAIGAHLAATLTPQEIQSLKIFSSTAVRAEQTAKKIASALSITDMTITPELLELDQGEWQGELRTVYQEPEVAAAIKANSYEFKAPGGESQKDVEKRIASYITKKVLGSARERSQMNNTSNSSTTTIQPVTIVVGHGMAFKCFMRHILDSTPAMTTHIQFDNCSITEVAMDDDKGWYVLRMNDQSALILADAATKQSLD
jgi:broad specificity phosphatase PhoE